MIKIGLLSDTHSYLDPKVFNYFESCDEIWHAGDIGSIQIVDQLKEFKKTQIVFGNIDDHKIRTITKEHELFQAEDFKVLLIHIAGKFGSYNPKVRELIKIEKPGIIVCGHSHILKVAFDQLHQVLYINPGACGKSGFQKVRTLMRFTIDKAEIKDMEVIELNNQ
ncbi:MAG: metallophosphoesterase family protein [Saprospiraceae bacterium]|nr:metallophosphoesterase family protein [Saprospiraceae bacterium]MBK8483990.1 metallophosphoesterase family protein [Saprospiraceae bacterium]MBK9221395.1 metallophosphoesterase family protein [Saprospiraceae bacterium]MBK9721667.1 metallophosphoesterase family protein [Saprospiraceae bacterium]MBK9728732.1 metallophosphoesterase family protein [Saprospiraceae bacterium]